MYRLKVGGNGNGDGNGYGNTEPLTAEHTLVLVVTQIKLVILP